MRSPRGSAARGACSPSSITASSPTWLYWAKDSAAALCLSPALIVKDELNSAMAARALGHYTHEKSPVACAAALATLDVIEEEKLCERAEALGARAVRDLKQLQEKHQLIGDVRGIGLLLGVELVENRKTFARATDAAERVMYGCMSRGLSFKVTQGNILTLTPPLTLSDDEWDRAIGIIDAAIDEETGRGG